MADTSLELNPNRNLGLDCNVLGGDRKVGWWHDAECEVKGREQAVFKVLPGTQAGRPGRKHEEQA